MLFRQLLERAPFWIHCHTFVKAQENHPLEWYANEAISSVRNELNLPELQADELHNVRNVAARKEMFCVSLKLPAEYLCRRPSGDTNGDTERKRAPAPADGSADENADEAKRQRTS